MPQNHTLTVRFFGCLLARGLGFDFAYTSALTHNTLWDYQGIEIDLWLRTGREVIEEKKGSMLDGCTAKYVSAQTARQNLHRQLSRRLESPGSAPCLPLRQNSQNETWGRMNERNWNKNWVHWHRLIVHQKLTSNVLLSRRCRVGGVWHSVGDNHKDLICATKRDNLTWDET